MAPSKSPAAEAKKTVKTVKTKKATTTDKKKSRRR